MGHINSLEIYVVVPFFGYEDTIYGDVVVFMSEDGAVEYAEKEQERSEGVRCIIWKTKIWKHGHKPKKVKVFAGERINPSICNRCGGVCGCGK